MAKITAKEVNSGAAALLKNLTATKSKAKEMLDSLRARGASLRQAEQAQREEQEREQRQKRLDAAVKSMNEQTEAAAQAALAAEQAAKAAAAKAAEAAREQAPSRDNRQFDRPRTPGQPRPMQGDRPQGPRPQYGRPVQGGAPAQGDRPQGSRPQYGKPVQGGVPGQRTSAPGQQGGRTGSGTRPGGMGGMGGMGGFAKDKDAPTTGNRGARPGQGGSRPAGTRKPVGGDLMTPTDRPHNTIYDPKKNQYQRPNDPEHNTAKNKRQVSRSAAPQIVTDEELERGGRRKTGKKAAAVAVRPEPVKIEKAVMTSELITVRDLSERIGKPATEIIKKLFMLGTVATINQELDFDTAQLICTDYDIELEQKLAETAEDALQAEDVEDTEDSLEVRPPIVTVMGHVDHGKTSLLDYIRKTRVTAGEAGGITQHIGAYTVELDGRKITFLDTPGHEAFTSMRARGAQATDIAIIVVAADDGVMPQTIEAINHAKAAGVQIIVAINKMDKPTADPERIREEMTKYDLVCEEWGGDTIMVPVSAHTGMGIDNLLEMVLLTADVQEYKANPNRKARGVIIEAKLDKGRGPVATVLVKNGTLRVGDTIVAGTAFGRVRAMVNDKGARVKEAYPSDPVEVIGFNDVPDAGDIISAVDDDSLSRKVAEERKDKAKAALVRAQTKTSLDDLFSQISEGQLKELNLIIKADVMGSVEAVKQSMEKLSNEEVKVKCIHGGVGAITETDVMLATASNAIIIGFNVRHDASVGAIAEREKVDIREYRIIYQAIEDVQAAMKGMLAPKFKETVLGRAQVRQTFRVSGVGMIAGSYVMDGKIQRNAQIRLLRDNIIIHEGKIDSLKRFKDDAKEVAAGYECGIGIENYNDIKVGDEMECFIMEEIDR